MPRGSVGFYNNILEDVLSSFATIEKTYKRYLEIKADQTTRKEQIDLATASATLTLQQAQADAQTVAEDMRTSATVIRQL
jgi:cell envelope opacity-associated protein A